jgi:hypothetical protein
MSHVATKRTHEAFKKRACNHLPTVSIFAITMYNSCSAQARHQLAAQPSRACGSGDAWVVDCCVCPEGQCVKATKVLPCEASHAGLSMLMRCSTRYSVLCVSLEGMLLAAAPAISKYRSVLLTMRVEQTMQSRPGKPLKRALMHSS